MTIRHHISDALLLGYSAGQLPEAFSLVVATHLSMCDDCRAQLAAFDAIGGSLMEECDDVALPDMCLEATLSRLTSPEMGGSPPRTRRGVFPAPLVDYVGGGPEAVKWRPIGMGVRQAILRTAKGASARLLYIPAGQNVPDHGHRGMEMTLVLQGAFRDEADHFGPGDVELADEDLNHTPVADFGADCICLAATDAPLRFSGLLPRIAQPFFRI